MATNLVVHEKLLSLTEKASSYKTKKETVNTVLEESVRRRRHDEIATLFGTI